MFLLITLRSSVKMYPDCKTMSPKCHLGLQPWNCKQSSPSGMAEWQASMKTPIMFWICKIKYPKNPWSFEIWKKKCIRKTQPAYTNQNDSFSWLISFSRKKLLLLNVPSTTYAAQISAQTGNYAHKISIIQDKNIPAWGMYCKSKSIFSTPFMLYAQHELALCRAAGMCESEWMVLIKSIGKFFKQLRVPAFMIYNLHCLLLLVQCS